MPAEIQSIGANDPDFLRLDVERVVQAVLEAKMAAHLHTRPSERSTEHPRRHSDIASTAGSRRDVLIRQMMALPAAAHDRRRSAGQTYF